MKQERRIWRAHVQPVVRHSEVGQKTGLWVITPSLHRAESTPAGITDAYWYDGGLRSAGIISELVARKVSNRNLLNPLLSHLFAGARSFEDLVLIQFEKRFLDRRRGPAILFNRLVILSSPRRAPTERARVEALC